MKPSDRPGLQERQRHWWRAARPGARPCHPGRPAPAWPPPARPVRRRRCRRAVIRTVPAHHAPRTATVLSGSTADAVAISPGIGPPNAAPLLRTDIGRVAVRQPRVVPQRPSLQFIAGGIMRGRKRSRLRRPTHEHRVCVRGPWVSSETDARADASLRALARLLARQAARELFDRSVNREADTSTEEGRE